VIVAKFIDLREVRYQRALKVLADMADTSNHRGEFIEIMTAIRHLTEARRERKNVRKA
jgi:hypothetical protein